MDVDEFFMQLFEQLETALKASGLPELSPPFITSPSPGVYRVPLVPPSLCASLLSTVDAYEATDLPKRRPNTMNNHGLVLTEIGLLPYATSLLRTVIGPLARVLFEGEAFADTLDCHHTFSVEYRAEELGNGDR